MKLFAREPEIEKELHISTYIVVYKFVLGFIESLTGVVLAFFGSRLYHAYQASVVKELSEDPHDVLARISELVVPNFLTHNAYVIVYLLVLGVAKMLGAIGLVYGKNWGVDLLVGLTILMAPFQIINLILHPHIFDLMYFAVGLVIALYLVEFKPGAWVSRILGVRPHPSGS